MKKTMIEQFNELDEAIKGFIDVLVTEMSRAFGKILAKIYNIIKREKKGIRSL